MKVFKSKIFIILLVILLIVVTFLVTSSIIENRVLEEETILTNETNSKSFHIYISNDGENYSLMSFEWWPTEEDNYVFNKAECYDSSNTLLDDSSWSFTNGKLRVYTTAFVSCNVYFDYKDSCNDESITVTNLKNAYDRYCTLDNAVENDGLGGIDNLWDSTLSGDGYRYISEVSSETVQDYCSRCMYWFSSASTYCFHGGSPSYGGDGCLDYMYMPVGGNCNSTAIFYSSYYSVQSAKYICRTWHTTTTYTSTDPDNYICYGTNSKSTCLNNTDKYLYRIIGIFADSSGHYHLKLIKAEALDTTYAFSSSVTSSWDLSTLYTGLNSTSSTGYYYYNTDYIPNSTWRNLIEKWSWKLLNSGYLSSSGTKYNSQTGSTMYTAESSTTSKVSNYVGLMYPADYLLSLGSAGLSYTASDNYSYLQYSWLYLTNSDSSAPSSSEYILGIDGSSADKTAYYYPTISSTGTIASTTTYSTKYSVRPVIYLKTEVIITGGDGTSSNPYILSTTLS